MSSRGVLEVRQPLPGEEERLLASFNRAFAATDPSFRPRSLASWRWRFRDAPDGARMMLAVAPDGEVVAQYAGLGQCLRLGAERLRASQSVDSFVDPAWRGGLGRSTAFVQTGLAYAELFGGDRSDRDALMWGLPVPAAWRIGRARLGYGFVRSLLQLVADPGRLPGAAPSGVELEQAERFPHDVDELFERLAPDLGLVAQRDRRRLDWRYAEHPEQSYAVALARVGGALAGCCVYRSGTFDGREAGLCCDWLVDRGQPSVGVVLRTWLAERARVAGLDRLVALLPDTSPEWLEFQRAGWRVEPTRYDLVARSWRRSLPVDDLRGSFWLTLGDTDLV